MKNTTERNNCVKHNVNLCVSATTLDTRPLLKIISSVIWVSSMMPCALLSFMFRDKNYSVIYTN